MDKGKRPSTAPETLHVAKQRKADPKNLGNIKVMVRVRPSTAKSFVQMPDVQTVVLEPKDGANSRKFRFDRCYWSYNDSHPDYASQETVYETLGAEMLQNLLSGYNSCILAYGQTGSGKTYSMMGNGDGLIPKTCRELFRVTDRLFAEQDVGVSVKVSFFEIYQEQVFDLLGSSKQTKLKIRESQDKAPFVDGLSQYKVESYEEVLSYIQKGNSNRSTAATSMNKHSSRSHSVFTLSVTQEKFVDDSLTKCETLTSHLRLVDLAGSERATATLNGTDSPFKGSGNTRFREGSQINKSLTTLGRVLTLLAQKTGSVIPYRESALTWILKESIGGNSKTAMLACVSPSDYDETLSTLRYATVTSKIQNIALKAAGEASRTVDLDEIVQKYEAEKQRLVEEIAEDHHRRQHFQNYVKWNEEYLVRLNFRMRAQTRQLTQQAQMGNTLATHANEIHGKMKQVLAKYETELSSRCAEAEARFKDDATDSVDVTCDLVDKYIGHTYIASIY